MAKKKRFMGESFFKLNSKKLTRLSNFAKLVLLHLIAGWAILFTFTLLNIQFDFEERIETSYYEKYPKSVFFFIAVIVAPVLETILFQFFVYKFLNRIKKNLNLWAIFIVSALLFAFTHTYNWLYFVYAFCMGIVLIHLYHKLKSSLNSPNAILGTIICHSLFNLSLYVIDPWLEKLM